MGDAMQGEAQELTALREALRALEHENAELRSRASLDNALRSEPAHYEAIVATLAEGVVLQGGDGRILANNLAAERILGLTADQMAGRTSTDPTWRAVHEDGSPFPGETHPAMVCLRTGQPVHGVIMGVHKPDGSLTWILIHAEPLFDPGADTPHAVVTSFSDVTAQKASETRAKESEEHLRFALDSARMGIWRWDVASGDVRWSGQVERIFGMEPGTFAGTYAAYIALVHPDDRTMVEERIEQTLLGSSGGDDYIIEHRIVRPDGSIGWIEAVGRVARDARGKPLHMAGTAADNSARKLLEEQLRRAQRMETVGRLAGGIAHDFNNLLTVIVGCADLAATADALEDARHAVQPIQDAAAQATRLTTQLLSFARKGAFDLEVLDLGKLVGQTERLLRRVIGEDIVMRSEAPADPVHVRADRTQLEQVLVNLAVNAREAMPAGGSLTVTVGTCELGAGEVAALPAGRYALLDVVDTGSGIPAAALPKIFDPFFTTKELGTGLGLATCYGIVSQLGGEILVDSDAQTGCRFSIYLPLTDPQPTPSAVAPPSGEADGAAAGTAETDATGHSGSGCGGILLVEDNAMVRSIAERALRAHGYEVCAAADGPEALSRLTEGSFDLMLTDVVMPKMSGYELARKVRAAAPQLPILFVSGYAEQARAEAGGDAPADAVHLDKPYTIEQLLEAVRQLTVG